MKYLKRFTNAQEAQTVLATWPYNTVYSIEGQEGARLSKGVAPAPAHEYVDLGVVLNNKKILFATKNVGADTIYEYGNYYAWGETTTKNVYSWNTYKWGTENSLTKYNSTDRKVILDSEDDPVYVNMGGQWRSPSKAELNALLNQTTNVWVTNYQGSGINGRVFTGTNNKTLFIPAAGCYYNANLGDVGSFAYWWTGSLTGYDNIAQKFGNYLFFYNTKCYMNETDRFCGLSARGVFTEDI